MVLARAPHPPTHAPTRLRSCETFFNVIIFKCERKIAKSCYWLHQVCPSVCHLSTWNNSDTTGWIFMKFGILTRTTGTLQKDHYTFFMISHSVLLRMKNVSEKICRINENTLFMFNNFYSKLCRLW